MVTDLSAILIRRAAAADLPPLAEAHRASILEIGPVFYPPEVIAYWGRERDIEERTYHL
jgi:hypothetical protein